MKEKKNSSVSDRHYEKKDLVTRIGFSRVIRHASKIEEDPSIGPKTSQILLRETRKSGHFHVVEHFPPLFCIFSQIEKEKEC